MPVALIGFWFGAARYPKGWTATLAFVPTIGATALYIMYTLDSHASVGAAQTLRALAVNGFGYFGLAFLFHFFGEVARRVYTAPESLQCGLFEKRGKDAEGIAAVQDDAIKIASEKWLYFTNTLVFKEGVSLSERIATFSVPMYEGLRKNIPAFRSAPDALLLIIVAKGIAKSGTHSRAEIEQAIGGPLPD